MSSMMTDDEIRAIAREEWCDDDLEINEDAPGFRVDGGAWVQAWVYVALDYAGDHKKG